MPLNLEYIFIFNIFMAILTTLCERADNHAPRGTLHSEIILKNKLTLLNLEINIVIYTVMTIKGTARCA